MQKSVNLVDLVKSFHTSICLQKSASIQPRTSLSKFGGDSIHFFNPLLSCTPEAEEAAAEAPRSHPLEPLRRADLARRLERERPRRRIRDDLFS